jgi:hypothetical protein
MGLEESRSCKNICGHCAACTRHHTRRSSRSAVRAPPSPLPSLAAIDSLYRHKQTAVLTPRDRERQGARGSRVPLTEANRLHEVRRHGYSLTHDFSGLVFLLTTFQAFFSYSLTHDFSGLVFLLRVSKGCGFTLGLGARSRCVTLSTTTTVRQNSAQHCCLIQSRVSNKLLGGCMRRMPLPACTHPPLCPTNTSRTPTHTNTHTQRREPSVQQSSTPVRQLPAVCGPGSARCRSPCACSVRAQHGGSASVRGARDHVRG